MSIPHSLIHYSGVLVICSLIMTACGGGGGGNDNKKPEDQPPPEQPVNVPDTQAPSIINSTPRDGAYPVSVISPLTITLSEAIDPTTVNRRSVILKRKPQWSREYKLTATYSALNSDTNTITTKSSNPLPYWYNFTLTLTGIRDIAGNTMPDTTIYFSTYKNPESYDISYNYLNGDIESYTGYARLADGNLGGILSSSSSGPDGQWFTDDDIPNSITHYYYTEDGRSAASVVVDDPGPDLIWNTVDDVPTSYTRYIFDHLDVARYSYRVTAPGTDLLWYTPDDDLASYYYYDYDSFGRTILSGYFNSAGNDTWWFTPDDQAQFVNRYGFDTHNHQTLYIRYTSPGADGFWLTEDDAPASNYHRYVYDPKWDVFIRDEVYTDPGPDGLWLLGDDDVMYAHTTDVLDQYGDTIRSVNYTGSGEDNADVIEYTSYSYDDYGNPLLAIRYLAPGPDSIWFTGDDVKVEQRERVYNNAHQLILDRHSVNAGSDGEWLTGDDILYGDFYSRNFYNENGTQIYQVAFTDRGVDNLWFTDNDKYANYSARTYNSVGQETSWTRYSGTGTADDIFKNGGTIVFHYQFVYDENGNYVDNKYFDHPGPDGAWFTDDDRISERTLYDASY